MPGKLCGHGKYREWKKSAIIPNTLLSVMQSSEDPNLYSSPSESALKSW